MSFSAPTGPKWQEGGNCAGGAASFCLTPRAAYSSQHLDALLSHYLTDLGGGKRRAVSLCKATVPSQWTCSSDILTPECG